jgi:type II secretory pathway pseudopilin PulG
MIELLVSISIIGILAGIALVSFTGAQRQARDSERKSDLTQYQAYLESYANANDGFYPIYASTTSLVSVCETDLGASTCPEDETTGQTYLYMSNFDGTKYAIWASLEGSGQYWTACSNGRVGQAATTTTNGDCPVADVTSSPTPAYTNTPTNTPTPTATFTPTPIPFPCTDGILDNGCFEDGITAWTGISGGASIVTSEYHTGTHSLQITQPSSGQKWVRQARPIVGGQNYSISGWMKTSLTSGNAEIFVYWSDSTGTPIWTTTVAAVTGTTNWAQYSTNFTAPAAAVTVTFQLDVRSGPGGNAWFDDLFLQ